MKKLATLIIVLTIIAFWLAVVGALTTNAPISNDIAIDQLNGGDEAYIALQAYTQYSNTLFTIACAAIMLIVVLIFVFTFKAIKTYRNNSKNDKEN